MVETTRNKLLPYAIAILGSTTLITQLILLRAFISVFSGNELVMGILLANWMLITGLGAYVGRFLIRQSMPSFIFFLQMISAILPILTVFLLNFLRYRIFPYGVMLDLFQVYYFALILLLPFCLLTGILFTAYAVRLSSISGQNEIRKVYAYESAGGFAGGFIFSLLLVFILSTYQILLIILLLNAIIVLLMFSIQKTTTGIIITLTIGLGAITALLGSDTSTPGIKYIFNKQEIIELNDSPYGQITITRTGDQLNYYENGNLIFNSSDVIENEENVHYPMLQGRNTDHILVLSGNPEGSISELLKYKPKKIDFVEQNPILLELAKKSRLTESDDQLNINLICEDPSIYLRKVNTGYDVIIINSPDPSNAMVNRVYTDGFIGLLHSRLNKGGVLSLALSSSVSYPGEELLLLSSSIFNTLKEHFEYVLIVQGNKNYFLASDHPMHYDFILEIRKRDIENQYVNEYYIDSNLLKSRSRQFTELLDPEAPLNFDFKPIAYYYQVQYWLSHFRIKPWIILLIILIIWVVFLSLLNPVNYGLFTGGFTAASSELLIIISFQIIYGYVYQYIGIIICCFMAGLYCGAWIFGKFRYSFSARRYVKIQLWIALYAILLPLLMLLLKNINQYHLLVHLIIYFITMFIGGITGFQYAMASSRSYSNVGIVASGTYASDLAGSALGALLTAVYLIPVFGLVQTGIFLFGVNLFAAAYIMMRRRAITVRTPFS